LEWGRGLLKKVCRYRPESWCLMGGHSLYKLGEFSEGMYWFSDCLPNRNRYCPKIRYTCFIWKSSILRDMSCTAKVCRVCPNACFTFAEVFYASSWGGLFCHGALGYARQGYRAHFATFRITAGGVWVIGVLLKEGFDSYKQAFPLPLHK